MNTSAFSVSRRAPPGARIARERQGLADGDGVGHRHVVRLEIGPTLAQSLREFVAEVVPLRDRIEIIDRRKRADTTRKLAAAPPALTEPVAVAHQRLRPLAERQPVPQVSRDGLRLGLSES